MTTKTISLLAQGRGSLKRSLPAIVAVLSSCGILDQDRYVLQVGRLEVDMIEAHFASRPDTVRLGEAIEVSAMTEGPASDDLPTPETEVEMDGNIATIVPFDYYWTEGEQASGAAFNPHVVSIAFEQPGAAEIRITGVDHTKAPLTLTKSLWVSNA